MYSLIKIIRFHRNKLRLFQFKQDSKGKEFISDFKSRDDFIGLFNYFQALREKGYKFNRTRYPSSIFVSKNGKDMDAIEGVTRYLPYWSVYTISMKSIDKCTNLRAIFGIIKEGTSRFSRNYWGDPDDYSQILCEASDVAITLWILKNEIDDYLSKEELVSIIKWFKLLISKEYHNNNWVIFKITVELFLKTLGENVNVSYDKYLELKSWYAGDGWFRDGQKGEIDYYSCWGFAYGLFWINEMDPNFDSNFIKNSILELAESYTNIVNGEGVPAFFGRSIPYRLSSSTPLICAAYYNDKYSKLASAVLCKTFNHFSINGAFSNGMVTSGYYKTDYRFIDNYSGPNSSLWSLRGVTVCEYIFSKGKNLYKPGPESIEEIVFRREDKSFCGGLLSVKYDGNKVLLRNKTLKYKGYSSGFYITIKVFVKSILDTIIYFRRERQVLYRENTISEFSSDNKFYTKGNKFES
ncbi:DUF2264 domain-containing protein [Aliivibrio fischeri]|uniref:DUF2264 domain-containing protein n=1 Tax=Aliivibrio fischeri TaxID=668 RepID=UPI0012D96C20|nr:DUF2264 domain-containing protein [Aliivibrio fischeri]MUK92264.1 DUF2264 domain-containing protein [Aliivibrio fischeri]